MTFAVAPQIDSLLGPGLTAEQARAIYERGEEAVIFALLELAKHWSQSEGRNASIDSPATPSGMKPAAKKSRKKPGRKAGHPGSRRPPPETIDEHKSHRATCCPHCAGRLSRCAQTRVRYIEDIPADLKPVVTEHTIHRDDVAAETVASQRARLHKRLDDLIATTWEDKQAKRLIKRLRRHRDHLLTFLDKADVPYDNNAGERAIRPAVIIRKNSYCNRSQRGADTQAVLMSIYRTLKQRGHDPLKTITQSLATYLITNQLPPLPP